MFVVSSIQKQASEQDATDNTVMECVLLRKLDGSGGGIMKRMTRKYSMKRRVDQSHADPDSFIIQSCSLVNTM